MRMRMRRSLEESNHRWASRAEEHGRARRGETGRRHEPGRNNGHGAKPVAVGRGSLLDGKERECVSYSNESRAMKKKKSQRRISYG
jgi:hypothetical protein